MVNQNLMIALDGLKGKNVTLTLANQNIYMKLKKVDRTRGMISGYRYSNILYVVNMSDVLAFSVTDNELAKDDDVWGMR